MNNKISMIMKMFLFLVCIGFFSFNAYSQSKLLNAAKGTKVVGEAKESKANPVTVKKKTAPVPKDLYNKYASTGYMEITGVTFANVDKESTIINDYGTDMYASEIKYFKPKVFYKGLADTDKNITLYVKILKDDGSVMSGADSPEGYTFKNDIKIEPGSGKFIILSGWGNNNGGSYSAGQYKYEIWYNGNIIFQKGVHLYSGSTPLASSRLIKINNIEFINTDDDGNVIGLTEGPLHVGEVQYLKPKLQYQGLYASNQKISLMMRIFEPDGDLFIGKDSPLGFTYKREITIKPGSNTILVPGWGNAKGTAYEEGEYKYEVWLDGEKIYQTTFNIQKSNSNNSSSYADNGQKIETTKIVDLGLSSKTKWAGWNVGAVSPEDYGGYYAWGETVSKHPYTWDSYFDIENKKLLTFKKYSGSGIRSIVGTSNDVAKVLWGDDWRMPTKKQIDELLRDCQWTWTSYCSRKGFAVKGPNGKCIFFPASGSYFMSNKKGSEILNKDDTCYYWCGELEKSEIFKSSRAYCLILSDGYSKYYDRNGERCDGKSVRAVYVGL